MTPVVQQGTHAGGSAGTCLPTAKHRQPFECWRPWVPGARAQSPAQGSPRRPREWAARLYVRCHGTGPAACTSLGMGRFPVTGRSTLPKVPWGAVWGEHSRATARLGNASASGMGMPRFADGAGGCGLSFCRVSTNQCAAPPPPPAWVPFQYTNTPTAIESWCGDAAAAFPDSGAWAASGVDGVLCGGAQGADGAVAILCSGAQGASRAPGSIDWLIQVGEPRRGPAISAQDPQERYQSPCGYHVHQGTGPLVLGWGAVQPLQRAHAIVHHRGRFPCAPGQG